MRVHATRWLLFAAAIFAVFSTPLAVGVALAADPSGSTALPATSATTAPTGPALTRFDQSDAKIGYSGAWSTVKKSQASAKGYARSNTAGASVNIAFEGTRLDWIATQAAGAGAVDVYLDGAYVKTMSLASAATAYQRRIWSTGTLPSGTHTVRIVRSASSASGAYINTDAVEVAGTLVKCQWVDQGSSLLARQGSSVTASFTGTYLAWMGQKGSAGAGATVTLDGGQSSTVDLESSSGSAAPSGAPLIKLWETGPVASGVHTVVVEPAGAAGAAGFLVVGTMTQSYVWRAAEDTDARVLFWGAWAGNTLTQASGGATKRAYTAGAMVTITFTGQKLYWYATTGPGLGKADVSVDSGPVQVVDLAGDTTQYQQKVWNTGMLESGTHTVQISWNKGNAAGKAIEVDVFGVLGDLPATTDTNTLRVMWAEQKLLDLTYRPGKVDGTIDRQTRGAVVAFQKWEGLSRTGKLDDTIYARLLTASRPTPKKQATGTWIEVDKTKQILIYIQDGTVVRTLPVATGSPSVGIATPSGTFQITPLASEPALVSVRPKAHNFSPVHKPGK